MDRLRLRISQDFLKPRIARQRVTFPARPQIGKGDAVINVIDRQRSCEQTLEFGDGFVGFSGAREDQSLKSLRDGALDHVPRDGFQLHCDFVNVPPFQFGEEILRIQGCELLVNCLRLGPFDNCFEARVLSQRIPEGIETKCGLRQWECAVRRDQQALDPSNRAL
jgi:hypothetical protein